MLAVFVGWLRGLRPDYRKHLLREKDEDLVAVLEHHAVSYTKPAAVAVAGFALLVLPVLLSERLLGFPILLGFGLLAWAAYVAVGIYKDIVVVTNLRVFKMTGLFTKKRAYIPISRILDITVVQPFWGRFMDYGHFVFESAAQEQGLREVRNVRHFARREAQIIDVVHPRKSPPPGANPTPPASASPLTGNLPAPRQAAPDRRDADSGGEVVW